MYNRLDHKLELYESSSTDFSKMKSKITNGKIVPNNPMRVEFQKRMKDTTNIDSLSYGSVEYEISFVSGYKIINMTRSDISKSFKINDDSVKLIDVFDNKVVLEQIDHHTYCVNKQLLNTDSIGRKAIIKHKPIESDLEKKTDKESIDYAGESSLTLPKETYLLFKNNPDVTLDEYISNEKTIEKNKKHIRYILLASPAPINSNFTIYFPIYGFSRVFTVKLKDKTTPKKLK